MRFRNQEKDDEIIEFISEYSLANNGSPTLREIAREINLCNSSTQVRINKLIKLGKLENVGGSRGYRTKAIGGEKVMIPLAGVVACGTPMLAEENIEEYFTVSESLLGSGEFFALRCAGDSMIDAGIEDGDIVFIKRQNYANEGDIVVALCAETDATLKRYYVDKENKKIILRPENKTMRDIRVDNCEIQGVAVKMLKNIV